ncbi:DASS family sodium-coupled anion symporter [Veillonella magna]|uniref:DASS family sodium-coupled anion symporter n=1 Tax=Veillonella magna TaxID=464322 RepID=A0ABS2GEY7_9FIRM|nr:DASS family sodium-coupled anion symporter [Veillonella magna]MBM6824392.1 DASS family sodium-coupled anion symporter [Veillonella magna]MBM6912686.1 DASS family sodium-coupled anion symporter [Veillonella magna]
MSSPSEAVPKRTKLQNGGLIAGFLLLIAILLIPTAPTLTSAGHRMIAILFFSIVIWMTSAVSYPVSATMITALTAMLLGTSPDMANPAKLMGTKNALSLAISGYSNTAWALVAAAMFISVAMTKTGLDRRIAISVLSKVGTKVSRIYIGVIATGFILSFFVPSSTARLACLIPIILGIIENLGVNKHSRFASLLVIGAAQADTLWNIMVQTAAAQNLIAVGFINSQLHTHISWLNWLLAAAPFSLIMVVIYYFLSLKLIKPEFSELPGGKEQIQRMKDAMGPMSFDEKKLLTISIILLGFWATGGKLHSFDTSTTTIVAIALFFMPGIGIMDWKFAQPRIGWGSIVMFGVGISLGTALLKTKAALWLADAFINAFSLDQAGALALIAIIAAFLILIHLGFASATALAAAMIPIVISIFQRVALPGIDAAAATMILQFSVCFGFILPVNSPQGMVAYSSDTFEVKDFIKTGVPITIIGYILLVVMAATYWHWLGYV